MHPSALKVYQAAESIGLQIEIVEFTRSTRSAAEAAAAISCHVSQIVKSLIFTVNGSPVLTLVAGDNRLDDRKLADLLGVGRKKIGRADADFVKSTTGFSIGGVPPFGLAASVPVFMDIDLTYHDIVWAAAGTPHAVFAITPKELQTASGAMVAELKSE